MSSVGSDDTSRLVITFFGLKIARIFFWSRDKPDNFFITFISLTQKLSSKKIYEQFYRVFATTHWTKFANLRIFCLKLDTFLNPFLPIVDTQRKYFLFPLVLVVQCSGNPDLWHSRISFAVKPRLGLCHVLGLRLFLHPVMYHGLCLYQDLLRSPGASPQVHQ